MHYQQHREVTLPCSSGMVSSLAYYKPGTHMGKHWHDHTQVSFLLSGEMLERHPDQDWSAPGFGVGVKPAGLLHENIAGPAGILVFTAGLPVGSEAAFGLTEPGWSTGRFDPGIIALVRSWLSAQTPGRREEAVVDLLALRTPVDACRAGPPLLLEQARQAIMEEPHAITIAAARVGRFAPCALFDAVSGLLWHCAKPIPPSGPHRARHTRYR